MLEQPMSELVFRTATPGDAHQLARLRWDFSPEQVAAGSESLEQFQARFAAWLEGAPARGWTVWLADHEGAIVSNIWINVVGKVPRPGIHNLSLGYVTNVYTVP